MLAVSPHRAFQDHLFGLALKCETSVQFHGVALRDHHGADKTSSHNINILEMSLLHVVPIIIRSFLWISSCIEPSSQALTVSIEESCDCTDLKGIVVLELDFVKRVRVTHYSSPNVSSAALAQISTAVAVGINAERILDVLAAPIAFNIVVKVIRVVKQLESLLTVLSIGIEIVAEIHGVA